MSKYDLYRNTICKEDDNDYILLFKDEESAKNVYDEFNQKDQRIAELENELEWERNDFKRRSKANDASFDNAIHELEVYKKALDIACDELEKRGLFAQDEVSRKILYLSESCIDQARKEV